MAHPHTRISAALAAFFPIMLLLLVPLAGAQTSNDALAAQMKAMEDRIKALEAEVRALKAQPAAAPAVADTAPAPLAPAIAAPPASQAAGMAAAASTGGSALGKILNPDISLIGNFLGAVGHNPVRPTPSLEMSEAELGLRAIIDPYAQADVFLSFGEKGVNLEEGYLTFTSLPGALRLRVGKMRAEFGKVNTQHSHVLPWTDRPLVTENLVGGEDGIADAGFSLTRILPAPKGIFLEGTAQLFRGDSENLFTANRRSDVSVVGHLRGYGDLSESTNLEVGTSYSRGHNELGSNFLTNLYGADVSLRWKPLRRAIYHSFLARSEFIWTRKDLLASQQRSFGMYSMAEYRVNRRWTVGGRYDYSQRADQVGLDRGASGLLTYWPSEFSQVRAQYRFANYAERIKTNELRFQFLFVMGAHGAHPF